MTVQEHLRQARQNEALAHKLGSPPLEAYDWAITVMFYALLHFVDAYLLEHHHLIPRGHTATWNRRRRQRIPGRNDREAVASQLQERLATTAQVQIILVTSAFHMRRSCVLFARAGFQVVPFPVDCRVSAGRACTILDLLPDANSLRKTETALREWYGFLFYQLVGR